MKRLTAHNKAHARWNIWPTWARAYRFLSQIGQIQGKPVDSHMHFCRDKMDVSDEFKDDVAYVIAKGFLRGDVNNNFNPQEPITIGEFQCMFLRDFEYWR